MSLVIHGSKNTLETNGQTVEKSMDMTSQSNLASIVVPVFNEEETLPHSISRLILAAELFRSRFNKSIELIFVNDGSRDDSQKILESACQNNRKSGTEIRVLELSRNFGHSAAVLAGLANANGEWIGIIDADLQDPPELFLEMADLLVKENVDVVYGQRRERQDETWVKRFTAWVFYRLLNIATGIEIPKDAGDFRIMRRPVVDAVLQCREQDPFLRGLIAWVGFRQRAFPYTREGRKFGSTKYTFAKMLRFASLAIVSFSSKPLRAALYFGIIGLIFSIGFMVWALYGWMLGTVVPGWASLLMVFNWLQSIVLLILGIHGVYLGRVFEETLGRPRFLTRSMTTSRDADIAKV